MDKFSISLIIVATITFSLIGYIGFYAPLKASTEYWAEVDRYNIAQLEAHGLTVLTVNMPIPHSIAGTGEIDTFVQWANNLNETTVYKIGNNMYYLFETQHINGEDFKVCYWYQGH
jgi:hypothetical protein